MERTTALLLILTLACSEPSNDGVESVSQTVIGDTVVLTTDARPPVFRIDSVGVFWQSNDLGRPQPIGATDTKLLVGDRDRLHVLDLHSGIGRTMGRSGEGPGEYRLIVLATEWSADSILVVDGILRRASILSPDGEYVRSESLPATFPFVNFRRWNNTVVAGERAMMLLLDTNMDNRNDVSTRSALTRLDFVTDSSTVIAEWPDLRFMNVGARYVAPRTLFVEELKIALSPDGSVAVGDGLDYCFTVRRYAEEIQEQPAVRRVCRVWERPKLRDSVLNPDFSALPITDEARRELYEIEAQQSKPDYLPSYDQLRWDASGRVWVRTVPAELADIHPLVLAYLPESGPEYRRWEVFRIDGSLEATLEMPGLFVPSVITEEAAYAAFELASGELTIGRIELPAKLRNRTGTSQR